MVNNRRRLAAFLLCAAALPALAQDDTAPLSAIDWLSDSVATPVALPRADTAPGASDDVARSALPAPVETLPLDRVMPDSIGLLSPEDAGLPADLWGQSPAADLAARLRAEPLEMPPQMQRLMRRILLTELDPPVDASADTSLYLARIDRLLELGNLDEADALLSRAPHDDPDIFRRAFDVALLNGRENAACEVMRTTPDISPTYPARIFCLARGGDWQAAALTLETAHALEILTPDQDHLLARFLDPDLFEGLPPPRVPLRPSPLTYRLYEAIGEPQATDGLPIAFAHADLRPSEGWKARLTAAERLAATGAIDADLLYALYRERRPAASGGVWDRAAGVQALDAALVAGDGAAVADILPGLWGRMVSVGLEVPFAETYGARLAGLNLPGTAGPLAFRIGLLSPDYADVAAAHRPATAEDRFLTALARGFAAFSASGDPLTLAIRDGFQARGVPARYAGLTAEGKPGDALLLAIRDVAEGAFGDYARVTDGLAYLRHLGLEDDARRAAIELLVLERRG